MSQQHFWLQMIAMVWTLILCCFVLVGKLSGMNAFFKMLCKLLSVATIVYIILELLKINY